MDRILPLGVVYVCCSTALALALPNDVLARYEWARYASYAVAVLIPSIKQYAALSRFPEVTALYLAVSWISVIVLVAALWRALDFSLERAVAKAGPGNMSAFTLGPIVLLAGFVFVLFDAPSKQEMTSTDTGLQLIVARMVSESRFALGLLGGWIFLAVAIMIVVSVKALIASWRAVLRDRFTTNRKGNQ